MLCQLNAFKYEGEENEPTWASSFQSWRVLHTFRSLRNAQTKFGVKTGSHGNDWNRGFTWAPARGLCGKGKVRALRHPRRKLAGDLSTLSWHFKALPSQHQNKIDLIISPALWRTLGSRWPCGGFTAQVLRDWAEQWVSVPTEGLRWYPLHTPPEEVILKFPRERRDCARP